MINNNTNKKEGAYKVPEHYFEELSNRLKTIPDSEQVIKESKPKVFSLIQRYSLAIAAIIILALFVFYPQSESEELSLDDVEAEVVQEYLIGNYSYDLSDDLLVLELEETDIPEGEFDISDELLEEIIFEDFNENLNYEYL